jgi:Leucine-rich repeat (LRR) protein
LTFGPLALAALPEVKKVVLDRSPLGPLPADLLRGDRKLEVLEIVAGGLEGLPKGFFDGLDSIKTLNLKDNLIKAIDNDALWPLKALQQLNLNGNRIEAFSE